MSAPVSTTCTPGISRAARVSIDTMRACAIVLGTNAAHSIPGSAKSDRDAVFTMQANEAGSLLLRWEITGTLQPGTGGTIKFKARVR